MEQVLVVFADYELQQEEQSEFLELVQACDMEVVSIFTQAFKQVQLRTYIGKGKCEEIFSYVEEHGIERILFHKGLSAMQVRNLEEYWNVPVMDRSELILEIFSRRAKSPTARLQIENAQLKKQLPRLIGANTQLGRQSASGKNKGVGEKQLELDKRRIKARIAQTTRELKELKHQRSTQRKARQKSTLPLVSLVGYTNAGKSTIMNALLDYCKQEKDKKVLEQDMLFATLDTSIRRIDLPYGESFLLSDTVGFVRDLPHELVEAFHSTLEEVTYADLLLQVVDASSIDVEKQMQVTSDTLDIIHANHIPMLTIYNQCDKTDRNYPNVQQEILHISAKDYKSIELLQQTICEHLFGKKERMTINIPYEEYSLYHKLMEESEIISRDDQEDGMHLELVITSEKVQNYLAYQIK